MCTVYCSLRRFLPVGMDVLVLFSEGRLCRWLLDDGCWVHCVLRVPVVVQYCSPALGTAYLAPAAQMLSVSSLFVASLEVQQADRH